MVRPRTRQMQLLDIAQRTRRSGIAGKDNRGTPRLEEPLDGLQGELIDNIRATRPVRRPGTVGQKQIVVLGQLPQQGRQYGETTKAGIEDADHRLHRNGSPSLKQARRRSPCGFALARLRFGRHLRAMDLAATTAFVALLAREAGEIILRHFAQPIPTQTKTSRIDIVTAADQEVEAHLVRRLKERFPSHHLVGEEGGGQGARIEEAPYHWYVDPIDGTVNFASKLPHFCTSIALTTPDREPLLGVVYDPTRRELFTATRGGGAFLNDQRIHVTPTNDLVDAVITSGFPYDKHTNPDNNLREWSAFLTRIRGERRLGSAALDLCYVAAGRLDGYWEKDLKPYDALAGLLLVREAGGQVTDYQGGLYPQRQDRGRYVASNGHLQEAMLAVLQGA